MLLKGYEGLGVGHQLKEDDSEGPAIDLVVVLVLQEDFWRHCVERAALLAGLVLLVIKCRQAKVYQLHLELVPVLPVEVDEEVLKLYVPMNYVPLV